MIKYDTYRDGGTKSFKSGSFRFITKSDIDEVCIDNGIGSSSTGEWYLGYPSKGRLLTPDEKKQISEMIIEDLKDDIKRKQHLLEQIEKGDNNQ